jgi:hypothetical protein
VTRTKLVKGTKHPLIKRGYKFVYYFEGTGDNLYAYVVGNSWLLHLLEKQPLLSFQAPTALEHPKALT